MEPYQELEQEIGKWAGYPAENVVGCASGTAALHLALEAFQLPKRSKVITSDFNMIAVPRAIVMAGLEPVFVDCDERLCMDPVEWKKRIDTDTEVVLFTHIYGRRCEFVKEWDEYVSTLKIVEDLSEAHGIKPHTQCDAACWSFYRNKIIAGEEGGAVAFRDPKPAAWARSLRSLGFTDKHDFNHIPRGCNYRLSNCHARLIMYGLKEIDANLSLRREIEAWYDAACPVPWRMPPREVPWVYDIRVKGMKSEEQDRVISQLQRAGIAARHAFKPMRSQDEFLYLGPPGPNALRASREVLYLPIQPGVTTLEQVHRAFLVIRATLAEMA